MSTPPKTGKNSEFHSDDVQWCLTNSETLNFQSYADHFKLVKKRFAYKRYQYILDTYMNSKALENNFRMWKSSEFAIDYWTNKYRILAEKKSKMYSAKIVNKSIVKESVELYKSI